MTAGELLRDLALVREWKRRHPTEQIGYPADNNNGMWSWRGAYYAEVGRLVVELTAFEREPTPAGAQLPTRTPQASGHHPPQR
jgi:hypothetical protein